MSLKQINLKLCVFGKGGVGKTSLVNRYVHKRFLNTYLQTLGEDIYSKKLINEDNHVYITIHDIAGQKKFAPFRQTYLRGAQLGLAVFDLTSKISIKELKEIWFDDLSKVIDPKSNFYFSVVGNKTDLKRNTEEKGKELVSYIKKHFKNLIVVEYIETSAKENSNVDVAFLNLVNYFLKANTKVLSKFTTISYYNSEEDED